MNIKKIVLETEKGTFESPFSENVDFGVAKAGFVKGDEGLRCFLTANETPVLSLSLVIEKTFSDDAKVLNDALERSYGDLEWSEKVKERYLPWYFVATKGGETQAYGVKVRPSAFCDWKVDSDTVTLVMDVCNGTKGVVLQGRKLEIATLLFRVYDGDVFDACVQFCKLMCQDGIPYEKPIYGGNNWYYAYGNSSHEEVVEDSRFIAKISKGIEEKPFMIIDECWAKYSYAGPWGFTNEKFPDMKRLAEEMKEIGVRPGIWVRPLLYKGVDFPDEWVLKINEENGGTVLDITNPEAKAYALRCFSILHDWGYEMIKHDFTSYDLFGGFAVEFNGMIKRGDWSFHDRRFTNAEIVVDLYREIKKSAQGSIILGCNTFSHLIAGLAELQRTGDDTSGKDFSRTVKMGVNTLAFRMCQHNIFYAVDADCVGITDMIPWEQNEEWLRLVAESRTPLFVSVKGDKVQEKIEKDIANAFKISTSQVEDFRPLDWFETKTPTLWKRETETLKFNYGDK